MGLTSIFFVFAEENKDIENTPINLIISDSIEMKDQFEIEKISVSGEDLIFEVSYSGGCQIHEFNVLWNGEYVETSPSQIDLYLSHNSNSDLCESKIFTTFALKLVNFNEDDLIINFFDYDGVKHTLIYNAPTNFVSVNQSRSSSSCTSDAKICPDGSVVERMGANCEFQSCPVQENNSCNKDLKVCADGTIVSRVSPLCEFSECPSGDECNFIGLRTNGDYCSINKTILFQKQANSFCENNFECQSNVCISDKCISSNLLNNIFNWFRDLFD